MNNKYLLKLFNTDCTKYKVIDNCINPEWLDSEIYQAGLDFYYTVYNPTALLEGVNFHDNYMSFVQEKNSFGVNWTVWIVDMGVKSLLTHKNRSIRSAAKEYLLKQK